MEYNIGREVTRVLQRGTFILPKSIFLGCLSSTVWYKILILCCFCCFNLICHYCLFTSSSFWRWKDDHRSWPWRTTFLWSAENIPFIWPHTKKQTTSEWKLRIAIHKQIVTRQRILWHECCHCAFLLLINVISIVLLLLIKSVSKVLSPRL